MKQQKFALIACLTLAAPLAQAAIIIAQDNFTLDGTNGYSTGALSGQNPSNSTGFTGAWGTLGPIAAGASASAVVNAGGDVTLSTTRAGTNTFPSLSRSLSTPITATVGNGVVFFLTTFTQSDPQGSGQRSQVRLSAPGVNLNFGTNNNGYDMQRTGTIGTTFTVPNITGLTAAGNTRELVMKLDYNTNTVRFWAGGVGETLLSSGLFTDDTDLDDNSAGSLSAISTDLTGLSFNNISFYQFVNTDGTRTFSLDNVVLYTIPEPSAALLGGLGMLFMLRRRRN